MYILFIVVVVTAIEIISFFVFCLFVFNVLQSEFPLPPASSHSVRFSSLLRSLLQFFSASSFPWYNPQWLTGLKISTNSFFVRSSFITLACFSPCEGRLLFPLRAQLIPVFAPCHLLPNPTIHLTLPHKASKTTRLLMASHGIFFFPPLHWLGRMHPTSRFACVEGEKWLGFAALCGLCGKY